ncbi:MAG: response regulator transcription factor [Chloroflexi bacterium]|nr:response regulator transcription factor [Chloroflexota bacterium]
MENKSQPIQIMLVDDHLLFREGISSLLKRDDRFEILSEADNGISALEIIKEAVPDIVLMDVKMPGMNGIETTKKMMAAYPKLKVIMITASEKEDDLFEAVKAGAQGYILKTVTDSKYMRDSIFRVAAGEAIIPPAMVPRLFTEFAALAQNIPAKIEQEKQVQANKAENLDKETNKDTVSEQSDANLLTPREYQVLELVAQGLTNKGIAGKLAISENTVRSHLRFILDKLHMSNRVQAALWLQEKKSSSSN